MYILHASGIADLSSQKHTAYFGFNEDRPASDTYTTNSTWPPHNSINCPVRLGISTWFSARNPLSWKQLCRAVVFPFCFTGVPPVESLRSDTMALKGHELCMCRISGTNPRHPSAAAHEQDFQSYETTPLHRCPPCGDNSYTLFSSPGRPEDSSSCSTLALGFWAAAGGIGVVTLLAYAAFSPSLHEIHQ